MSNASTLASIGFESPKARGLLAALANLVKPMVYECMSLDNQHRQPAAHASRSSDGQSPELQFVNCLKGFIVETVEECRTAESAPQSSPNLADTPSPVSLVRVRLNVIEDINRPRAMPAEFRQVVKDYVLKMLRDRVSSMPTRLLAFDSVGSQIRLVGHREALLSLAEKIFADMDDRTPNFLSGLAKLFENDPTGQFLDESPAFAHYSVRNLYGLIIKYTRYTILSHTWTKDTSGEISYQDWPTRAHNPSGYAKIRKFCEASARDHDISLGWIDTCCINKESSAELDEAIRSMYKWYQKAELCLVYLSETNSEDDMAQDSWFTRGWTLQELVAPSEMAVYNKNWTKLPVDQEAVAAAAGIEGLEILTFNLGCQNQIPISRRLQMACGRQVTREEDTAYSLMGILDVSIPIAYGEGSRRAFSRLMREVISSTRNVMDIFNRGYSDENRNIIPSTVDAYKRRSDAFDHFDAYTGPLSKLDGVLLFEPLLLTHVGLRVHLLLVPGLPKISFSLVLNRGYQPSGDLYGEVWDYLLLDKIFKTEGGNNGRTALLFGVFNFSLTNGKVIIQNPCLSIPLQVGSRPKCGRFDSYLVLNPQHSANEFHVSPIGGYNFAPPVFRLKSSKDPAGENSEITVPENELMSYGLRRTMLYL